jgi:ribosomal protein S18 acetylase RimI-like enzyme
VRFVHLWDEQSPQLERFAAALSDCVHESSNPYADWYFGEAETAAAIISEWILRPTSEYYLGRSLVMLDDEDRPVGTVIGMSGRQLSQCRMADFAAFCDELGTGEEADEVVEQVLAVSRDLFPAIDDDAFYISRVAIERSRRGLGLGRLLVAHAIEAKRREGCQRFALDVSRDNAVAIRTYEALGLRITRTSRAQRAPLEYCAMAMG